MTVSMVVTTAAATVRAATSPATTATAATAATAATVQAAAFAATAILGGHACHRQCKQRNLRPPSEATHTGMVPNAEPLHKRALRVAMETFEFVFGSSRSRGVDPAAVAACESS